jgi:hypothetical protein
MITGMILEGDRVALEIDIAARGLKRGDVGIVVFVYDRGGYQVEFATAQGKVVETLTPKDVRPLSSPKKS